MRRSRIRPSLTIFLAALAWGLVTPEAWSYAQTAAAGSSVAATAPIPDRPARADVARLKSALHAARRRQGDRARAQRDAMHDPVARKLVDWALVDVMGDQMSAPELEAATRRLDGWPRAAAREEALQRARRRGPDGAIPYTALQDRGDQADRLRARFRTHRLHMNRALARGDAAGAYRAISHHGQSPGSVEYAEGESFAGWLALDKLDKPKLAARHFARLAAAVKTPVSKARAAYWRGRVAERLGDAAGAQAFYDQAAVHSTTFYGQLAAQRSGRRELVLTRDPEPSARERSAFARAELTQALRLLAAADERRLLRVFGLHYGDEVRTRPELVLLMDELKALGEQEVSLLAYRRAARHGLILHERGYPLVAPPRTEGGAEDALVLAITRQESQFSPHVRSSADARGMMQIRPATGRQLARQMGMRWSEGLLWDADANMRLGSRYLGQLVDRFDSSAVLAAAGYNAGPRRPPLWTKTCGDPRESATDPIDFIECIPFGETRNYVMNVMANYQVYRARLNGGHAPLTAQDALRRIPTRADIAAEASAKPGHSLARAGE